MQCIRSAAGEMLVQADDGRVLAKLNLAAATPDEFDRLAARLAELIEAGPTPRVAIRYREGLLDEVQADIACEIVLIEEDRFDDPPINRRSRPIAQGDSEAVDAAIARG